MEAPRTSTPEDIERTQCWLAEIGGFFATFDVLSVLARCRRRYELEFIVSLLALPGWEYVRPDRFQNGRYRLSLFARVGDYVVDLLLRSGSHRTSFAIDLAPPSTIGDVLRVGFRPKANAIRDAVGHYIVVAYEDAPRIADLLHRDLIADGLGREFHSPEHHGAVLQRCIAHDVDWSDSSVPERQQRLRAWLHIQQATLGADLIPMLAQCETSAEMRFALPILRAVPWKVSGPRRVADPPVEVSFQEVVGSERVAFLLPPPSNPDRRPVAVDIERQNGVTSRWCSDRRGAAAKAAGYRYRLIRSSDAPEAGRRWAAAFREARYLRNNPPTPIESAKTAPLG
jgi:hypothetical protein